MKRAEDLAVWILSPEGQQSIRKAAEQVARVEDRLRRASVVPPEKLMEPLVPWRS